MSECYYFKSKETFVIAIIECQRERPQTPNFSFFSNTKLIRKFEANFHAMNCIIE